MLKSVFYRVMNWIFYTLILSFLPIIIGFILEAIFEYDFTLSNLANLYIAACALSITVHRDSREIAHPISHGIQGAMILGFFLSTAIFTVLCVMQGENKSLSPAATTKLLFTARWLFIAIAAIGIGTQIYMEWLSYQPNNAE